MSPSALLGGDIKRKRQVTPLEQQILTSLSMISPEALDQVYLKASSLRSKGKQVEHLTEIQKAIRRIFS